MEPKLIAAHGATNYVGPYYAYVDPPEPTAYFARVELPAKFGAEFERKHMVERTVGMTLHDPTRLILRAYFPEDMDEKAAEYWARRQDPSAWYLHRWPDGKW